MTDKNAEKRPAAGFDLKVPKLKFLDSPGIKAAILFGVLGLVCVWIAVADLNPDLGHLDNKMLSGSTDGNYYALVGDLGEAAKLKKGALTNESTAGSQENLTRLAAAKDSCDVQFALVQDGQTWPDDGSVQLLGRLRKAESVFFLGKNADAITTFRGLKDKTIGVGPKGSGTAQLTSRILAAFDFSSLDLKVSHHSLTEQLDLLKQGKLDLGVFVMDEDSRFISNAVVQGGLQIASFEHVDVVARRLPFLGHGRVGAGQYDPISVLPNTDKRVLRVHTLVLGNGCAERSQTLGLLELIQDQFPDFIGHNRNTPNMTGLTVDDAASSFFANEGTDMVDAYFPWVGDIMPPSNWVHIIMAVSILFNIMGFSHRFRLWRIDANRVKAELFLPEIFGPGLTVEQIGALQPGPDHQTENHRIRLDQSIAALDKLSARCRTQSLSVLVPMGHEMVYRYQEQIMRETVTALRGFRARLNASMS